MLIKVDEMCDNRAKVDENSHRLCYTFSKRVSTPGFIPKVKCWKLLEFFFEIVVQESFLVLAPFFFAGSINIFIKHHKYQG